MVNCRRCKRSETEGGVFTHLKDFRKWSRLHKEEASGDFFRPIKAWEEARDCFSSEEGPLPERRSRFRGELVRVDESPNPARGVSFSASMTVGVRVCKLGDTVFVEEEWRIVDSQCSGESKCRMTHEEPEQKHRLSWLGVRCRRGGARKKQTDLGFSQGF